MPPTNSGVTVIISGKDDLGPVLDKVEERLRSAAAAGQRTGEALSGGIGHGVTEVQAASAALRSMEGAVPIRAVERFITLLPGVGTALLAAFPLIGLIDFGILAGRNIGALIQTRREAAEAGDAIARAYRDVHASAAIANDDLRITDDRLQNEIARLEHKPQNNLKLAIDEDRKAVDELSKSLDEAAKKSAALLKEKSIGAVKAFITGQDSTKEVEGSVNSFHSQIADLGDQLSDAAASGDKGAIAKAKKNLADKQNAYAAYLDAEIKKRTGSVTRTLDDGEVFTGSYSQVNGDQRANLAILRGERTAQGDQREGQTLRAQIATDTGTVAKLKASEAAGKDADKAIEAARKLQDARDKLTAAETALANASQRREESAGKTQFDFLLAANEDAHKRQLESDEQYYRDKAQIQSDALRSQQRLLIQEQANLEGQMGKLQAQPILAKSPQDREVQLAERSAKVAELKAKIVDLDAKSADLTAKQAQNTAQLADSLDTLAKRRTADADAAAAKLESARGGPTQARSRQSRDEYLERRQGAVSEFGGEDNQAVRDIDSQQSVDQAGIGVAGAQQQYASQAAALEAQRRAVEGQEARGSISRLSAQQQRIALDSQEAEALQPVLAASQQLAPTGDLAATEKVAELQERISELKSPVNDVALEMRNQFDGAFEGLFENLDKGKSEFKRFGEQLKRDALQDIYKTAVQPLMQQAFASIMGKRGGGQGGPAAMSSVGGAPSMGSALGGLFGNMAGVPTPSKTASGGVTVNIINQTSSPATATASQDGDGSNMLDSLRGPVTTIVLQDLESNSSIAQALGSGLSGLMAG